MARKAVWGRIGKSRQRRITQKTKKENTNANQSDVWYFDLQACLVSWDPILHRGWNRSWDPILRREQKRNVSHNEHIPELF